MVAALRSDRGASRQPLLAALEREVVMLVSVPLMIEYEAVLKRPEHLDVIGVTSDEMVLETAVNGRADRLVTFNLRHLGQAAREFGMSADIPGAIWREIRGTGT